MEQAEEKMIQFEQSVATMALDSVGIQTLRAISIA